MQQLIKKSQLRRGSTFTKLLLGLYTLFLFVVTLLPSDIVKAEERDWLPEIFLKNGDKVVHFTLFFIFTYLLYQSAMVKSYVGLVLLPFFVGILIELLQYFTHQGRSFDLLDILANTIGILIMVLFLFFIKKRHFFH
ncbi:MAG: VanZ family protein [Moheibacter sp.]